MLVKSSVVTPATADTLRSLAPTPAAGPVSGDAVELPCDLPQPAFSRKEMVARYASNLLVHLGLSDTPNIVGMLANVVTLPPALAPLVTMSNVVNTVTGLPAIAADIREIRGTYKNPLATRTDRVVDVAHLLGGDLLSTAGSLIPFVASMSHPLALGIFLGSQTVGIAADLAKTAYAIHRRGQQSAYHEGQAAVAARHDKGTI